MDLFKHHTVRLLLKLVVKTEIVWLTADEEDEFTVAQANSK